VGKIEPITMLGKELCLAFFIACTMPVAGQEFGDKDRGRLYALRACAECHAVLQTKMISPNRNAPAFTTVANTPGMTGTALAVWFRS
jgi:hypothetical protein